MTFGCNVMDLFRQLGIEEEFLNQAKLTLYLEIFNLNKELLIIFDNYQQEERNSSRLDPTATIRAVVIEFFLLQS